jgi:Ca2+-binding EF-hand superfamily protein
VEFVMKPALFAFAAALAASPVAAQPPAATTTPPPSYGFPITRASAQQQVQERFALRDANHDGFMANDELGGNAAAIIGRLDTDHDGKVSLAEAMAKTMADFEGADADHDGTVTQAEADAIMAQAPAPAAQAAPAQPQGN